MDKAQERKLREALLHPSEEVHRVVLGAISDAVFITDDLGNFTYICPNVFYIFARTFDEVAAMGTIAALLGSSLPPPESISEKGEVENLEMEITDGLGRSHTLLVNVKRVAVELGTILYTCRDITERKQVELALAQRSEKLFEEVVKGRNQLRNLARREVAAQERERKRISRELHDEAGQYLTALQIMLKVADNKLPDSPAGAKEDLAEAVKLVDAVTDRVRRIAQGLRPPALDTVGIKATLAGLCREVSRQSAIPVEYEAESVRKLTPDAAITLYRVLQEALTNSVKHAAPAKIAVRLYRDGGDLVLSVADDGKGFCPEEVNGEGRGLGLAGMRERLDFLGGGVAIESSPGMGAAITARAPLSVVTGGEE